MSVRPTDTDANGELFAYVVLSRHDGKRWIVDKVQLPVNAVHRGRIASAMVDSRVPHGVPVGRVFGIHEQTPQPTVDKPAPGQFVDQWRAILFALGQIERLPVFAQKLGQEDRPIGDYRRVRRSEPGEEFAFGDEPTRIRIVAKKNADLDADLKATARIRVDLWAHSPVEIDPDDPAHALRRDRNDRVYFEFDTDFPDEVCRVINQYGHNDDLEAFRVGSTGIAPLCPGPASSVASSCASAAQPGAEKHSQAATHGPSGI